MHKIGSHFLYILFLVCGTGYGSDESVYEETVRYYENLIQTETEAAFNLNLPTSAEAHRPIYDEEPEDFGTFDFIIVGAGTAGSVVASRLSEISEWKILVIEAGGPESAFSDIPGMHMYLQGLRFNWNFNTTPQADACLGMVNRQCAIQRGKVLGGTSGINGLVYSRGSRHDFDGWAAEGNTGWSYEEVLPYFIKSENSQVNGDLGYHGTGGKWNVEYPRYASQQLISFIEAHRILYNYTSFDYNGQQQLGMFYSQLNNINGRRDSTDKAFLMPARNRENLWILVDGYVTKVMIGPKKIAWGVEFTYKGKLHIAKAKKEVIVSAGAIQSPQILMLSGIGPQNHLEDLGIPVVQNLPVGERLQDHATFFGLYAETNSTTFSGTLREQVEQYLAGYGPLAIALNSQGIGFHQSSFTTYPDYPDYEYEFIPSVSGGAFLQNSLHLTDETYTALWSKINPQTCFNVYIVLLHPLSVGTLKLQSKDPYEYPLINPQFLSDYEGIDIDVMYQALQTFERLIQTEPMRKLNTRIVYGDYPQCRNYETGSIDYWYCAFRLLTAHLYHPIATCKMGTDPEKGAVVDPNLKVYGIDRLRVVDLSVVPFPTSGHTSAPAVMIGEKASDIIKLHYGKRIDPILNVIR